MGGRNFIYYRKTDRIVIIVILAVALACAVLAYMAGKADGEAWRADADSGDTASVWRLKNIGKTFHRTDGMAKNSRSYSSRELQYDDGSRAEVELFIFDPNTADSTALLRLGLQPWQVRNIYRYRNAGGIYRRPEDFARLYGLTVKQYRQLKPYIRISADYLPAASLPEAAPVERDTLLYPRKIGAGEHVVLNTADTTQLRSVPGIGRGFARAVVAYGKRLGGYVDVAQLDEIADFPQEAKQYFVIDNPVTIKLNVNKLSVTQLSRHPYITFHQAKAIADYRRLHGKLHSLNDLKLHRDFTDDAIRRLLPYVEF